VNNNGVLKISSLLSLVLLTLHVTDDIVRGISKAESSNIALAVLVVFLYGTLVLAEQRWGHVIMFLVGLFAVAMPVMHMRGAHYPEIDVIERPGAAPLRFTARNTRQRPNYRIQRSHPHVTSRARRARDPRRSAR